MPELAEVEYFRKQWNPGLNQPVKIVALHAKARIFRGINLTKMSEVLTGARFLSSEARGKQMIFRFSRVTLGLHLGMTGELRTEPAGFEPGKHDHLVLFQAKQTLVFADPRLFGRVLFGDGKADPAWWTDLPPDILSPAFTAKEVTAFLARRKGAPIKAILLMQERFPGIGNWMADEILWRAQIHPSRPGGKIADPAALWKAVREVSRQAVRIIGVDWSDPPDFWLFNHRWKKGGSCPRCGSDLKHATIGGRTTCWCPRCQPAH